MSYILQPTRLASENVVENILINSSEYLNHSGNLTVQISDLLFQFTILEGFFKEAPLKSADKFERNFKNFNEREFAESINEMDWENILDFGKNDPNLSMNNLYLNLTYMLDKMAPYKMLSKKNEIETETMDH